MLKGCNFFPLLIALAAAILVAIWFNEGLILGVAEAEIPFYNLARYEQETAWAWQNLYLGVDSGLRVASHPSWWFLSQLQKAGIAGYVIQASSFWLLLFSAGMGICMLCRLLFPSLGRRFIFLAVLFYYFNPLSLVSVWNRFLYNYIVFWALLPIAVYLFIKGLQQKKLIFSVVLSLAVTLFSYAFSGYVFNLLFWLVLGFTWLFLLYLYFSKDFILFAIKYFLLALISFVVFNFWWLLPFFGSVISGSISRNFSTFVTTEGNLYTLSILSQKIGNLIDITRLISAPFYQGEGPAWTGYYNSAILQAIFFAVSGLILWTIYKMRDQKFIIYLGSLFLGAVFLAKGNNPPFGGVFQFLFVNISFFQVFRDPFEKFSFLISLPGSLLFAIGISKLYDTLKFKIRWVIYPISLIIVLGVFGYPFFAGLVFTNTSPPNDNYAIGYKVQVPEYYKEADQWLQRQGQNFRFISFPLGDEGMTYKWEKGYQGVEPSEILFSVPGITFNTSIPYFSQIVEQLERLLFQSKDFSKVTNLLNAKYLLLHSDVDIRERRLRDPEIIRNILETKEKNGEFKKVGQFGNLDFWESLKWENKTVYVANKPIFVFPQSKISDILLGDEDRDILLTADVQKEINSMEGLNILYPEEEKIETPPNEIPAFERNKEYKINIEKQSDYELILDNIILSESEASIAANIKVLVDKNPISQKNQLKNNKISYGVLNLNPGLHKISIERPVTGNLISAPEETIISTIKNSKQVSFEIRDFNPYVKYLVGLDYLISSGENFAVLFNQSNDLIRNNKIVYQVPYFNVLTRGQRSNAFIHANGGYIPQRSDSAALLFWADPAGHFEVTLKNISVNHLIEPQPLLIQNNPVINSPLPQITYVKHNPTRYSVRVKDSNSSFILILSELFNSNWEAILDDGTKVKKHFLANAYANGWLIDKKGNFDIVLEYLPQRLLNQGSIVSGVSIIVGLMLVGIFLIRRQFKR